MCIYAGRGHAHRVQHTSPPPSPEKALRESSRGNHGKQQETGASSTCALQKRRVSFAPTLSSETAISDTSTPPSETVKEVEDIVSNEHKQTVVQKREAIADDAVEERTHQKDDQASHALDAVSTVQLLPAVQSSPHATDMNTRLSPGSEEVSEEDSVAGSLSGSASTYESPQLAKRGRGKRGRPRGRVKRGVRGGRGGVSVEEVGGEGGEVKDDSIGRGRGGRGRKRRGRGSR